MYKNKKMIEGKFYCLLCKGTKNELIVNKVRDSKNHDIVKCSKCNHVQLFPLLTKIKLKRYNDKNLQDLNIGYSGKLEDYRKKSDIDTQRRYNFIKKRISKKQKILEVGSGHGFLIDIMHKNGYNIIGTEISKNKNKLLKNSTSAKILNLDLTKENTSIRNNQAIILFHVLEHIENPIEFLKNLRNLLSDAGEIIIEVPNEEDTQLKVNSEYSDWFWQLGHIHYFSPKLLKFVLKKAGFKNIKILGVQRYSIKNMFNWMIQEKAELKNPTYEINNEYSWLEKYYKNYLEKKLICDTIIAIATK